MSQTFCLLGYHMVTPTSRETSNGNFPPHVEETVRVVDQMRAEHHTNTTLIERTLERTKMRASAPVFVFFAIAFVGMWIDINTVLRNFAWDRPHLHTLSLPSLPWHFFVTILILATQRRADALAGHREQLILQLAFVSEQKTAKL